LCRCSQPSGQVPARPGQHRPRPRRSQALPSPSDWGPTAPPR
jgi:hypothetical protein